MWHCCQQSSLSLHTVGMYTVGLSVQNGLVGDFDSNEQKLSQSPGMIAHVYNFSIWKAEAGGLPHV